LLVAEKTFIYVIPVEAAFHPIWLDIALLDWMRYSMTSVGKPLLYKRGKRIIVS
jgi:hypothetical protein